MQYSTGYKITLFSLVSLLCCPRANGSAVATMPWLTEQRQRMAASILSAALGDGAPLFKIRHTNRERMSNRQRRKRKQPWRRRVVDSDGLSLHMVGIVLAVPSKRLFLLPTTLAFALYMAKAVQSEPVRRAVYFWHHAGPIVVHYKFTKWWLTTSHADQQKRDAVYESLHNRYAQPALDLILHLTGLYVKMGQILSSRPDFMPSQYVKCFTELQDNLPAWDTDDVRQIALRALRKECPGVFGDKDDLILDKVCLGSASIGQVHRAILQCNGQSREVAVKVMHEGSKQRFQNDFQVFRWLCKVAIPSWRGLLDALEEQVMTEFDYRNEAESLREVRENIGKSPYRNRVVVPAPIQELCCEHVLIMEMLHGTKLIDSIQGRLAVAFSGSDRATEFLSRRRQEVMTGEDAQSKDIIRAVGFIGKLKLLLLLRSCKKVISLLVDVHGYQIFRMGTWNGDPHFGNCLALDDGRLGLIDYGQTRRIDDKTRLQFSQIVVSLDESRSHAPGLPLSSQHSFNATAVAAAMRSTGFSTANNSDDETMLQYARLIFDSDEESEKQGYRIPQEYFKALMVKNPIIDIPDSAIFVARTSLMFRGMGSAVGSGQIRTASAWYKDAKDALRDNN